jgi:hypothetical protein
MTLPKKTGIVLACLLGLLCAGMLARYLPRAAKRDFCDFRVYHHAAKTFLARQDIYANGAKEITPFKYSPFFALLFSPLGLLSVKAAAAVFFVVNFLAAVMLFWLAGKLAGARSRWVYVLAVVLLLRFVMIALDSGQVPIIFCCLVLASLYLFDKGKDVPASALLAASILFKYLPAVFIPYFIVKKRFKAAALTVVFLGLWLLLPSLYSGLHANAGYLSSWLPSIVRTSLDQESYFDFKNQSFFSLVIRAVYPTPYGVNLLRLGFRPALLLSYFLALGMYLLALVPVKNRDTTRLDYALLFTFLPLFNPNGWMHNFVALALPCALLLAHLQGVHLRDRFVLACLISFFVFTALGNPEIAGRSVQGILERSSIITLGALFLVAALARLKFSPPAISTS